MSKLLSVIIGVAPIAAFFATTARASEPMYWGYCNEQTKLAYADPGLTVPKPEANWVCAAPTADKTGDATEKNTLRCLSGQRRECAIGAAGGVAGPGAHNVPHLAWYWIPGASETYPDVRCECGCFTGDVEILTNLGLRPIETIARQASTLGNLRAGTFDHTWRLVASSQLTNKDFTVGPEDKEVFEVETDAGQRVTMTENHPVLVKVDGGFEMVQTRTLKVGHVLVQASGDETTVTGVRRSALPAGDSLVYNLDTKGSSEAGHVIVAGGLRVGDVWWQKRLSEQAGRVDNLLRL